ncbi:MAG TPA: TIM-barrel domain-containing protein [Terriglobales bacterium]|nr:TIM-barrel domain-containing protein [Terriglobales bacterium]
MNPICSADGPAAGIDEIRYHFETHFVTSLFNRRQAIKAMAAASAAAVLPARAESSGLRVADGEIEIRVASISARTVRLSVLPIVQGKPGAVPNDGSLVRTDWGPPTATLRALDHDSKFTCGEMELTISPGPLTFSITNKKGEPVERFTLDQQTGALSFTTGDSPLFGLGEGGPQFDRRGSADEMRSGQGGYKLHTHGGRVPIPWIIGTGGGTRGWALFIHQPFGTFDFTGRESKFQPVSPETALPLDIFFISSREPGVIMAEYARLTGHAELPPLWSLGYQQSHRTLASREEVLSEAKTFREKSLPCDALIYLGTGFCPSGWNTENGSFDWNTKVFPDPKAMIDELHKDKFKVVLHSVILADQLKGTVRDGCELSRFDDEQASCYWDEHRKDFAMGVDGWWPDEGDPLDIASRLVRNRMYWEGPQIDRPNERPYALHRNGYAGMQRYASFLWSGDVYSLWETLKTHIAIGINTGLSGIPYWGTDIGGFVPTKEFTAELYLRWFQFGAFCPLFRCHGRNWKLRLPWQWNTGDAGPMEISRYGGAAIPDASELHNPQVEPICRRYLELRYRLLPYLYSAVRECTKAGMPIMRALWLHYPDDPKAVARDDEYLWGRDLLVAPIVENAATSREVYLPHGVWYDFWTNERIEGGREISRPVDLETLPLYVRAGATLPLGPVKQYVEEKSDEPLTVSVYPGADGSFLLYEDDGKSFDYRHGEWMGIQISWSDAKRVLRLRLAEGSKTLLPLRRNIQVRLNDSKRDIEFTGKPLQIQL